ncbi:MAG: hypothetical protein KC589_01255 [Nanoarchaeota archaeon]|nr:hypothetical protein [Nanoarchaeota archaeon]
MAIIDTSFTIEISDFEEIEEEEIKIKDMELNSESLTDEINPTFLDGCCGQSSSCNGWC